MKALKLKADLPTEGDEAEWLLQWARLQRYRQFRVSDVLIMIPNGAVLAGDRRQRAIQMARMKRSGFRPGVYDYLLAIPTATHPGLWLEMKRSQGGIVSGPQAQFKSDMEALGWKTAICEGWESARKAITEYLA